MALAAEREREQRSEKKAPGTENSRESVQAVRITANAAAFAA
jgi:hypothetical protein